MDVETGCGAEDTGVGGGPGAPAPVGNGLPGGPNGDCRVGGICGDPEKNDVKIIPCNNPHDFQKLLFLSLKIIINFFF